MKRNDMIFATKDECIRIERTKIGEYWITIGTDGAPYGLKTIFNPVFCGPFKDVEDACETLTLLRPEAHPWEGHLI